MLPFGLKKCACFKTVKLIKRFVLFSGFIECSGFLQREGISSVGGQREGQLGWNFEEMGLSLEDISYIALEMMKKGLEFSKI